MHTMQTVQATLVSNSAELSYDLAVDFTKDGDPAKWANGHPKSWGAEDLSIALGVPINHGAMSPDERFFAVALDTSVNIYATEDLALRQTLSIPDGKDYDFVEWQPARNFDSYHLVCTFDRRVSPRQAIWSLTHDGSTKENTPKAVLPGNRLHFSSSVFSRSGHTLLVYVQQRVPSTTSGRPFERRHHLEAWDMNNYSRKFRIENAHAENITCAEVIQGDNVIASCSADKSVKLWNADTGALLHTFGSTGYQNWVLSASTDDKRLACGGGGQLCIWDLDTKQELSKQTFSPKYWLRSISWSPDGSLLALGGTGGGLRILDTIRDKFTQEWSLKEESGRFIETGCLGWFDQGRKLCFSTGRSFGAEIYDLEENLKWRFGPSQGQNRGISPRSLALWCHGDKKVISLDVDGSIRAWALA